MVKTQNIGQSAAKFLSSYTFFKKSIAKNIFLEKVYKYGKGSETRWIWVFLLKRLKV